ncbi:MAG: hypothetical protein HC866_24770 [Leptolyngbyaceae cyanobacterium RU_5_1]|nr:hypothetical protein [Leptolyngbyaceae cyanobacterium RU_5_1]
MNKSVVLIAIFYSRYSQIQSLEDGQCQWWTHPKTIERYGLLHYCSYTESPIEIRCLEMSMADSPIQNKFEPVYT